MEMIQSIQNRIYEIRNQRIMLDFDLAALYDVETRSLNQAVKRNTLRFPRDFMFRLTLDQYSNVRQQAENSDPNMSSQFVMTYPGTRPQKALPYAFTEQGVAMLSGVLNSKKAIKMNIAIMRAFVETRKVLLAHADIRDQIQSIREKLSGHDVQLSQIYEAMENLLDEHVAQRKWDDRERIGFKKTD